MFLLIKAQFKAIEFDVFKILRSIKTPETRRRFIFVAIVALSQVQ